MLEFFGMVEVPLKPEQCFVSTSHREATAARLEFAIQHRQVGLNSAPSENLGKSSRNILGRSNSSCLPIYSWGAA
ncbi:hypothetical protein AB7942_30270 [Neobacillus sp. BF23-41]|uniref:hypothetical protein n=1 Tax=Neobacillus sp. BF23-41 TaxID=3240280 RepID=UPI0034E4EBEA